MKVVFAFLENNHDLLKMLQYLKISTQTKKKFFSEFIKLFVIVGESNKSVAIA
jgi:hypothetical protein